MPRDQASANPVDPRDWKLLIFLSVLWGGSFFFTGVAVRELPPLTIVLARVGLAALMLIPLHFFQAGPLPRSLSSWRAFTGMAALNNVIPFTLFALGQREIPSGLASVLNATTPLFTVVVMAAFAEEKLTLRKAAGVCLGLLGVAVLKSNGAFGVADVRTLGFYLCLAGALSYGFAGLWGRRNLAGVAPLTSATCQLICSTLMVGVLAILLDKPWRLPVPSAATLWSLAGFASLSTALAYIVFFRILTRSGASNVMLVTLLIPVTSIVLGHFVLGEIIAAPEALGALIVAASLLVIDGRLFLRLRMALRGAA
ncbi:MAG: DMT family transporter [Rhodoblastus sp.]|nr:DMT family transporter [Rhodoblastus sp.]